MKIFTWMQNKFNGRHESRKPTSFISASQNIKQDPGKEGFSERHIGSLLAIGTLGENAWKEDPESSINLVGNSSSSQDHDLQDLTLEELGKLQNELNSILHKQGAELTLSADLERNNVEWKNLLDKDSSLDSDDQSTSNDCNQQRSISIVRNIGKDVCLDSNSKGTINSKKSFSFLLEKMFVCSSGITQPAPSLRDHALPESRMEKIMRAILHKKIYPQSSSTALSMKKYLDNRRIMKPADDDQDHHELNLKGDNGSKWVNTNSEYIVLEI
ncbi:protein DEEPER ROOTING 1-like [Juglans microcarpa x Juglans regia]|uniref:protein DEEPER ROOTING 1-like n=1 Tax=Juglans microcarpa x Juglans regia TaxID=2249226 RepID=UPI001B7F4348|nr:protein DEEPER ROOTING 1-like [Juglans microcarpa x Juglans regia]